MNVRLEARTRLQVPFDADDFEILVFEGAVILPRRNQRDVEDVSEELRGVFVNDADGVLACPHARRDRSPPGGLRFS